jgi:hypothetical protein
LTQLIDSVNKPVHSASTPAAAQGGAPPDEGHVIDEG